MLSNKFPDLRLDIKEAAEKFLEAGADLDDTTKYPPGVEPINLSELVDEYRAYRDHAVNISKYWKTVKGINGFFAGAFGKVVRPYANPYNYSVYVVFNGERRLGIPLSPVLIDCRDLELVNVPGDPEYVTDREAD